MLEFVKLSICTLVLVLLTSFTVSAEEVWTKFTASSVVNDYALDDTYLWTATSHGLVRYDLNDMSSELIQLPEWGESGAISAVEIAGDGTIGVISGNGVSFFDGTTWDTVTTDDGIASNIILTLQGKPNGDFWFVTRDVTYLDQYQHIYRYCKGVTERIDPWPPLNDYYGSYTLIPAPDTNDVWCQIQIPVPYQSDNSVLRYDGNQWTLYPLGLNQGLLSVVYGDYDNIYLNVGWSYKTEVSITVYRINSDGFASYANHPCVEFATPGIITHPDGEVWVSEEGGLFHFDGESWTQIPGESYGGATSGQIAEDRDGDLYHVTQRWISSEGYYEYTLSRYDGSGWYIFDEADGLPEEVNAIYGADDEGRMWFRVSNGVMSYDGADWTVFDGITITSGAQVKADGLWGITSRGVINVGDAPKTFTEVGLLASGAVSVLKTAPDGSILAGTGRGLSRFVDGSWESFLGDNILQTAGISDIAFNSQGYAWAVSTNNGIFRQTADGWTHLVGSPVADYITIGPGDSVMVANRFHTYTYHQDTMLYTDHGDPPGTTAFMFDHDGRLWSGGSYNLFTWAEAGWDTVTVADGYGGSNVSAMYMETDGVIWIASGNMIFRNDGGHWTAQGVPFDTAMTNLLPASNGMLWVSTAYYGDLYVFDGLSWHLFKDGTENTGETITSIVEDQDGRIWISMNGGGVWRLDESEYISRDASDEQSFKWTAIRRAAAGIDNGTFTFTDDGGVLVCGGIAGTLFKDGTVIQQPVLKQFQKNSYAHDNGTIWFGTSYSGGVIRYDLTQEKITKTYNENNGLPTRKIGSFAMGPDHTLWVVTNSNNVSQFDGTSWRTYTEADGTPIIVTYLGPAIYVSPDGAPYFKGLNGVIYKFQNDQWTTIAITDGEIINTMCLGEGDADLWFGTENGVYHYDTGTITHLTTAEGLPTDYMRVCEVDSNGILWCTYEGGIAGYNGTQWITYHTPPSPKQALVAPDGALWCGTKDYLLKLADDYLARFDTISEVEEDDAAADTPTSFDLLANYPNPFNPTTTISFTLPESGMVRLAVYSVSGQKVATLVDNALDAGAHNMVFDGTGLASGIYVYRLETEGNMQTGKMLLMK